MTEERRKALLTLLAALDALGWTMPEKPWQPLTTEQRRSLLVLIAEAADAR